MAPLAYCLGDHIPHGHAQSRSFRHMYHGSLYWRVLFRPLAGQAHNSIRQFVYELELRTRVEIIKKAKKARKKRRPPPRSSDFVFFYEVMVKVQARRETVGAVRECGRLVQCIETGIRSGLKPVLLTRMCMGDFAHPF